MAFGRHGGRRLNVQTFTAAEIERIIEVARRYGSRSRSHSGAKLAALFALLAHLGPRVSEALALRWKDVDFARRKITLQTLKKEKPEWRTVPMVKPIFTELMVWRRCVPMAEPGDFVFRGLARKSGYTTVWAIFRKVLLRAGIPRARTHDLRHSFISNLYQRTRDLTLCRDVVGHSSISTTDGYAHAIRMWEAFEEIGTAYGPIRSERPRRTAANGNGHAANGACRCQSDLLARMERMEQGFVVLIQGLERFAHRVSQQHKERPPKMLLASTGDAFGGDTAARQQKSHVLPRVERIPLDLQDTEHEAPPHRASVLAGHLARYDLGTPTALGSVLGASRQYAHQVLAGKHCFGVKVAKRIGAAIGVPFSTVLEWQENGYAGSQDGKEG